MVLLGTVQPRRAAGCGHRAARPGPSLSKHLDLIKQPRLRRVRHSGLLHDHLDCRQRSIALLLAMAFKRFFAKSIKQAPELSLVHISLRPLRYSAISRDMNCKFASAPRRCFRAIGPWGRVSSWTKRSPREHGLDPLAGGLLILVPELSSPQKSQTTQLSCEWCRSLNFNFCASFALKRGVGATPSTVRPGREPVKSGRDMPGLSLSEADPSETCGALDCCCAK